MFDNTIMTLEEYQEMTQLYRDSVEINKLMLEDLESHIITVLTDLDNIETMVRINENVEKLPKVVRHILNLK